ncbi:MAG TPA: hypothetical protein VM283_00990 [Armatimonadota bacterium]|nr:hypothetical protein [Armatimonadota bacterium]
MCTETESKSRKKHCHPMPPFPIFPVLVPILFPLLPVAVVICSLVAVVESLGRIEHRLDEIICQLRRMG